MARRLWSAADPAGPAGELGPVAAAALEAAAALGHPSVEDHNVRGRIGAGPMPVNRVDGLRMSTALTYLADARGRSNLTIRPGTLVDRVVLDGDRAVGVRLGRTRCRRR